MNDSIFIQLYLDEDVDILVGTLLEARGFTVITTRDAGQISKSDDEQLAYAIAENKTLLTHNRVDFEALAKTYFAEGKTHQGIIIATRHSPYEIIRRLLIILNNVTADEMNNQLVYI
jgi:predicted nuclease of predicted toxin-antitoxin system